MIKMVVKFLLHSMTFEEVHYLSPQVDEANVSIRYKHLLYRQITPLINTKPILAHIPLRASLIDDSYINQIMDAESSSAFSTPHDPNLAGTSMIRF